MIFFDSIENTNWADVFLNLSLKFRKSSLQFQSRSTILAIVDHRNWLDSLMTRHKLIKLILLFNISVILMFKLVILQKQLVISSTLTKQCKIFQPFWLCGLIQFAFLSMKAKTGMVQLLQKANLIHHKDAVHQHYDFLPMQKHFRNPW